MKVLDIRWFEIAFKYLALTLGCFALGDILSDDLCWAIWAIGLSQVPVYSKHV